MTLKIVVPLTDESEAVSAQVFISGTFVGSFVLAVWVYLCFPGLRPTRIKSAIVHVAASFVVFSVVPHLVGLSAGALPPVVYVALCVAVLVVPALCYVYVSWLWLIGCICHLGFGGPRGGHLVGARR